MTNSLNAATARLVAELKAYLNIRLSLVGLHLSKRIATLTSAILTFIILLFIAAMFVAMLSFALVYWLGEILESFPLAFLIVAGLYALLGIVVYLGRRRFFMDPLIRRFNNTMANSEIPGVGLPPTVRFSSIGDQIVFMEQEAEKHEIVLQESYEDLTEQLQPANLTRNLLAQIFGSPAIAVSLLEMAIKLLRNRRKIRKKGSDNESDS